VKCWFIRSKERIKGKIPLKRKKKNDREKYREGKIEKKVNTGEKTQKPGVNKRKFEKNVPFE